MGKSSENNNKQKYLKSSTIKLMFTGILLTVVSIWAVVAVMGFFNKSSKTETKHTGNILSQPNAMDKSSHYTHKDTAYLIDQKQIPTYKADNKDRTDMPGAASTQYNINKAQLDNKGLAFVSATIQPISYELHERFWGWRPNDILNITDNVNTFQLGVLEVTRRTVVILTERISRTGSTAAFDKNLETAMNWFMVQAGRYWFPSPESKYNDGIKELENYKNKLKKHEANFYTRPDNLIPLLAAYEDLLGSCDENLVKFEEEQGKPVSFFKADDYFYYAQGVAHAMDIILEAVLKDFNATLRSRHGIDTLNHAIKSCKRATKLNPFIVTDSSLSGILANHRANMAAPISHARFYIGVLIKTLST